MIIKRSSSSPKGDKSKKAQSVTKIINNANDLAMKGEFKKAIKEMEKAIKLNPKDGNLYNRLGDLCIKGKEIEKAIDTYKKGVEVFESDYYHRNAVALCKKVLRYDPDNLEICQALGNLLIELGDKSDALNYFFRYIEKQREENNKKEVLKTLKNLQDLGYRDSDTIAKMVEIYKSIGREDLAKELKKKTKMEEKVEKPVATKTAKRPSESEQMIEEVDTALKKAIDELKEKEVPITDKVTYVEKAITELKKAVRLDKVISALEESLTAFSQQQKQSIALLQKSLNLNLDTLQDTIARLQRNSMKNMNTLEKLLKGLAQAMSLLSKSQRSFSDQVGSRLEGLNDSFKKVTKDAVDDIKGLSSSYKKASEDICEQMKETKESAVSLLRVTEELKVGIDKINSTLLDFITRQETEGKRHRLFFLIFLALISALCVLTAVSAFK